METHESFEARVLQRTGIPLGEIPEANPQEVLGAHIVARRDDNYIVFVGYPDEDENGTPYWPPSAARRISLAK